jgi:hypothetical protein
MDQEKINNNENTPKCQQTFLQEQQKRPGRRRESSFRARFWSLDSCSTITTEDETRDVSVPEHQSVSSPVVWEGGNPVELSLPTVATACNCLGKTVQNEPEDPIMYSTPIDLDIMYDYYQYEQNTKDVENSYSETENSPSKQNPNFTMNLVDLDLMDDFYKRECSRVGTAVHDEAYSLENEMDNDVPPIGTLRGNLYRKPSGGLESPIQLPGRSTCFEI